MTTSNPTVDPQTPSFVAWIGLDRGDAQHAFRLREQGGQFEEGSLPNTPEAVLSWCQKLEARFGGQPIALAYESTRNGLVDLLVTQTFFWLYPIHPLTSARFRQAFTPSGAKDDQPDAAVLLEVLLHHPDKPRCWNRADLPTEALARLDQPQTGQTQHPHSSSGPAKRSSIAPGPRRTTAPWRPRVSPTT